MSDETKTVKLTKHLLTSFIRMSKLLNSQAGLENNKE